jgi:hypothetical protein
MTPTAEAQNKTELFADELTRIFLKVAARMSKEEREDMLNKLNARLSSESDAKRV